MTPRMLLLALVAAALALLALGSAIGSTGLSWGAPGDADAIRHAIVWEIRLPRSVGAWLTGALLGVAGATAQGLFRNPLADPHLLGASAGAALGVALALLALGHVPTAAAVVARLGLTGAAFAGAIAALLLTLALARGVEHTMRLLLAGVVVGVVLLAATSFVSLMAPDVLRPMQVFMLGNTSLIGWPAAATLVPALLVGGMGALAGSRALDALTLGESTAITLGLPLPRVRLALVGVLALCTGAAVAQSGLVAFVGLVAPHLVRSRCTGLHGWLLVLSALAGGALLLAADIAARWLLAPQELPVGIVTSLLGGAYLLVLMHRGALGGRK
jgi:iron complex transport system permease protein